MAMTSGELTRGAVPTWRTVPAGEIGRFRGGSGFPLRFQGQASGEIPFFKVSDMNLAGNEKHMTRANHYISEAVRKQLGATLFPTGSIVFAKVGAAVFLERKRILAQPSCIDNNMAAFVLDASHAEIEFVHQLLMTMRLADLVSATALPALNGADLAAMPVSLPPIDCQREVAKVLRGPDALLAKLDQLIVKKRDLKQAAMQQLLTGRQRLPGFAGPWPTAHIEELADVDSSALPAKTAPDFAFNYISLEDVDRGALNGWSEQTFATAPSRARRLLKADDVLVSTVRPNLQSHLLFPGGHGVWVCSTGFTVLRARTGKASSRFLFESMFSEGVSRQIEAVLTGSNYPAINSRDVRRLVVPAPECVEQVAIAAVLADMDAELTALEARRDKTRQLKQGMMQALLTGRIRLV